MKIREINPTSEAEIKLVASRMRQTLVDVMGEEKAISLYTMGWLVERVKWHLDPAQSRAMIFLSETNNQIITGQAIVRIEMGTDGIEFGYFSTIYVCKENRKSGIGSALIKSVEDWCRELALNKITYWTAEDNFSAIKLFEKRGYLITKRASEMVELTRMSALSFVRA